MQQHLAALQEPMDKAVHSVSASWPGRLTVHYVHQRHHRRADHTELGFAYHADLFLVSSLPCSFSVPVPLTCLSVYRYFSIFSIYTPYTIYQCMFPILSIIQGRASDAKPQMDLVAGSRSFTGTGGNVCIRYSRYVTLIASLTHRRHNFGCVRCRGELHCRKGRSYVPQPFS